MSEKRFSTNGNYIYDHFREDKWLLNEVEAEYIANIMNNLDTKARENNKALSTLQKKLNELHEENIELHIQNDFLKDENQHMRDLVNENKQLKKDIEYYKTERRALFEYLDKKDDLKLEGGKMTVKRYMLDEGLIYDNGKEMEDVVDVLNEYAEENEQLKAEVTHWQILLNNYKEIVAKTLREQYHWLKNEDKILNQDKIVALLELEAIATYLGIELE